MFFFKKKKIVVEVFTHRKGVLECSKPKLAIKYAPDWWKKCPMNYIPDGGFFEDATIKTCPAFVGVYTTGLMIPMWCDLALEMSPIGENHYRWQFADEESHLSSHTFQQINNHLDPNEYSHFKLTSPWAIRTKEDINWMWMQPDWNHLKNYDYKVASGLRNFKTTHGTHINIFAKKHSETRTLLIKHLEPLVHLVPLVNDGRKIELKYNLVSSDEFNNFSTYSTSFLRPSSFCINARKNAN